MTTKKIVFLLVLAAGSVKALPFDSYTIWVDGQKVSVADVRAEVASVKRGEVDSLDLLLKKAVVGQLDFACSRFEQIVLLQGMLQYLSNHSPNPELESIYESRLNYLLEWKKAYPKVEKSEESYTDAREKFERSCLELVWILYYESHHLGRAEKMLRMRSLLEDQYEAYPLQADLWRLMLSVSVRDHLIVAISDESVERLLSVDEKDRGDLFGQVLGATSSLCKLVEDSGIDSYKKCEHYELWTKFSDAYSGKEPANMAFPISQ